MSARYGSRTRSGEAVSDLGRRAAAGGGGDPRLGTEYEEIFTAPGTWTNPGTVAWVEVLMVGGGGGGGCNYAPVGVGGGGGGGGRVIDWQDFPVSGPQPVVVGAGGTGGVVLTSIATVGGDSTFGAPGPTQLLCGGGGAGATADPALPGTSVSAPPQGGGGGGAASPFSSGGGTGRFGGNGFPHYLSAPTPERNHGGSGGGARTPASSFIAGRGFKGYGGGGQNGYISAGGTRWEPTAVDGGGVFDYNSPAPIRAIVINGRTNTGGGGAGGSTIGGQPGNGGNGGSGLIIVRWWE